MTETSIIHENNVECFLSKEFLQLHNDAKVKNASESLTILLHSFMLETGYIPKNFNEQNKYECMPDNWKTNGVYKIQYYHKNISSISCWMTSIPLYSSLNVHAALDSNQCHADVNIKLQIDTYVKKMQDFSDISQIFSHVKDLSRRFKDEFCFPLLALLYDSAGVLYPFGLGGLIDELKMYLLEFLPAKSVVSLSAVNKNFNNLCNSSSLWKFLYHRDFGKGGISDIATSSTVEIDWKKLYKEEHLKKKRKYESHPRLLPPYRLREIFPVGPDYDDDIRIIFHPRIEDVFPHLQRLQTPHLFSPNGLFRRYL